MTTLVLDSLKTPSFSGTPGRVSRRGYLREEYLGEEYLRGEYLRGEYPEEEYLREEYLREGNPGT